MASPQPEDGLKEAVGQHSAPGTDLQAHPAPATPKKELPETTDEAKNLATPPKVTFKEPARTPRLKKKVPWKGKHIMVLLPRDYERGQPGHAARPLSAAERERMYQSWEELGYSTRGFDLDAARGSLQEVEGYSQSRDAWPTAEDLDRERASQAYKVTLPDLNAWKNYVNEVNEAKLRALGVSFGEDEPEYPPPQLSRQASAQYPPLPFSPPIPTSSASSNPAQGQGFPFPGQFAPGGRSSAAQSPGIPSVASPVSFNTQPGRFNPRQSISIPMGQSPFQLGHHSSPSLSGWPMQGSGRADSPSMLSGVLSPGSPFAPDQSRSPSLNTHQRHQSLQYPMLPHQHLAQQPAARSSPRLQEVREDEEEENVNKSPSKTPEPVHKNSDDLQAEIDDAEYHLEEKMRNELEHADYSPHNEDKKLDESLSAHEPSLSASHSREPSLRFEEPLHRTQQSGDGPVLHHPRPHSRGHSLTKNFFQDAGQENADNHNANSLGAWDDAGADNPDDAAEIETNPSNLGTPVQEFNLAAILQQHQHTFSNSNNPWNDAASATSRSSKNRRPSHGSRPSHASKPSLSKLNVNAPEFKFNPTNEFIPGGQFVFGPDDNSQKNNQSEPLQSFQAGGDSFNNQPLSSASVHSFNASTSSNMNANVPAFSPHVSAFSPNISTFSPGHSDFSFSASGPKFRPDAPSFMPYGGMSDSFTSATGSGNESAGTRPNSIFGNINLSEVVKPAKKSKAIPIVRPMSRETGKAEGDEDTLEDTDGPATGESRPKRAKANADDGDSVPLFAEPTRPQHSQEATPSEPVEYENLSAAGIKSGDEDGTTPADTTMSSTAVSEQPGDSKAVTATSPSNASQDQQQSTWVPFKFDSNLETRHSDNTRPSGDKFLQKGHKKSLSATANAFVPGASWSSSQRSEADAKEIEDEDEDDREREATLEPPVHQNSTSPNEPAIEPATPPQEVTKHDPTPTPPTEQSAKQSTQLSSRNVVEEAQELPALRRGLGASRFASPPPKSKGLGASRFASPHRPQATQLPGDEESETKDHESEHVQDPVEEFTNIQDAGDTSFAHDGSEESEQNAQGEPTFEEIDAIMDQMQNDPAIGVNKFVTEEPRLHQPSPQRQMSIAAVTDSYNLHPTVQLRSGSRSPSPRKYQQLPNIAPAIPSTELEDPFVDPPETAQSVDGPVQRLNASESVVNSDWDGTFSDDEQDKLEQRAQFFDGRVNNVVGELLDARLQPLEHVLSTIMQRLPLPDLTRRTPSSIRRERRSVSAEVQESDADDEDEEPILRRSMSPRRDRRMEQIRTAVLDALATQPRNAHPAPVSEEISSSSDAAVLKAIEQMQEQLSQNLALNHRGEDFRGVIEEAVQSRMSQAPPTLDTSEKGDEISALQAKIIDLEERLYVEKGTSEKNTKERRDAEELAAELNRKLQAAETRVEVEIMNRSVYDQRIGDLEDRLKQQEARTDEEVDNRRTAEDRLSEVQRLLRISSEEENRLREVVEEREQKIKQIEQSTAKSSMRMSLLEAAQNNSTQSQSEMTNRVNVLDVDLREARKEANHFKSETERLAQVSHRQVAELTTTLEENKQQQRLIDSLGLQIQETERMREGWRDKFTSLQDEMTKAAREITEENARRTKKEQTLVARQEVLDAKLQAESKTRERLETELERLENGERQGLRAVNECRRLESLLGEMRTENHKLQQTAMRFQREYEEARESGASEVERTRINMQFEIDQLNNQVHGLRQGMDSQINKLQADLDQAHVDVESAKAKTDMLVEEAQFTKTAELEKLKETHANEVEDMQTRHAMQLGNAVEEAQKTEQHLLERLSFSASKTEHLQDRITHLEEKLEIAKEAAAAAAKHAKSPSPAPAQPSVTPASAPAPVPAPAPKPVAKAMELPEKISPQALRESIMVLQEQLQAREQQIEELEQTVDKLDPEAPAKMAKRDDEITWLRELLAVRHGDLQDIIRCLTGDDYDKEAVKDAAIRLKANLQMEEQERERAMNGGSAISLPSIAQSLQSASPRVAQAVGPLAAAWGNWRKSQQQPRSMSGPMSSPARSARYNSTPSKSTTSAQPNNLMGGLLTPPASNVRQTPSSNADGGQPTAFASTGRRLTSAELARQRTRNSSSSSRQAEKMPQRDSTPPRHASRAQPLTPPMMRPASYDSDAHAADFDENDFFEDED